VGKRSLFTQFQNLFFGRPQLKVLTACSLPSGFAADESAEQTALLYRYRQKSEERLIEALRQS
jgi:hypothetical protein